MKVVIFCGGLGVRMGEETQRVPKPMVEIGGRPLLWHIMRYYAAWGHNDFVLCLGYKGDVVKRYFLEYNGAMLNDFVLDRNGHGTKVELLSQDLEEWRITFVDTGLSATIGERLKAVGPYLAEEDVFLATYGDGLTDVPIPALIDSFHANCKIAQFIVGAAAVQRAPRRDRRWWQRRWGRGHEPLERPRQRRLLRLPPRDPRPDRAGRRARRGDVRSV